MIDVVMYTSHEDRDTGRRALGKVVKAGVTDPEQLTVGLPKAEEGQVRCFSYFYGERGMDLDKATEMLGGDPEF